MKSTNTIAVALIGAGLCTVADDLEAQTLSRIAETNKITVSYRESAVPFSYALSPTKAVGFSVDLTEAIIDDVRKKVKRPYLDVVYVPVTGQNRIPLLINGSYDLECGSTTNTAARAKDVTFAISHFYAGTRLLTKTGSNIRSYADLAKKPVAVPAGSTNEKTIRKYAADNNLDIPLVLGKDYGESMQFVENGTAVALALDDILLFGLKANAGNPGAFEVVGDTLQIEPYGCMLRKDDSEFKALVDGTITRLMKSGEFARLYAKWFESPIPPKGIVLNMPMSERLKANMKIRSDRPEQ